MTRKPWVAGPLELVEHGLQHLQGNSDFDTRMAMISIDNAVELMIKVYLGLPKRVTGIQLARVKYDEVVKGFPSLLEALEEYASDKISEVALDEIEWFHRLRNELYHQGNGITVEREKVEDYAEIAKTLMHRLFDFPLEEYDNRLLAAPNEVYVFLARHAEYEEAVRKVAAEQLYEGEKTSTAAIASMIFLIVSLIENNLLPGSSAGDYETVTTFKLQVVYHSDDTPIYASELKKHRQCLEDLWDMLPETWADEIDYPDN